MSDTPSSLRAFWDRVSPVLRGVWQWIVLVLVVVHLIAITLLAFPSPGGGLNRRDWSNPTVQAEFDAWNERLRPFGWTGTTSELQDEVYGVAKAYAKGHGALKKPFDSYYRNCGTYQSWRMFVAPHMYPSKLQLRVWQDGNWQTVYEARSAEHRWLAHVFDNDRMRSAMFRYGWGRKFPHQYKALGDWVAQRALEDFPEATKLQIRFANYKTPTPQQTREGFEPKITWKRTRTIRLSNLKQQGNR